MTSKKDWTGNSKSVFRTIGASNHTEQERETNDYYATEPRAVDFLLEQEKFAPVVWECACGEGHISKVLEEYGYKVISTDLIYRGYGDKQTLDFLKNTRREFDGDIITNPPYKYAKEFVEQALDSVKIGRKVAMLLKLTFLEGQARRSLFDRQPPKTVYIFSGRIKCAKNGDFDGTGQGAMAYAWFVWEKGFYGSPKIKWIN